MVYNVFANARNLGDYLSHRGIYELLGCELTPLYCDREYLPRLESVLTGAGPEDVFIVGGGGLICSYFEPLWRLLASTQG